MIENVCRTNLKYQTRNFYLKAKQERPLTYMYWFVDMITWCVQFTDTSDRWIQRAKFEFIDIGPMNSKGFCCSISLGFVCLFVFPCWLWFFSCLRRRCVHVCYCFWCSTHAVLIKCPKRTFYYFNGVLFVPKKNNRFKLSSIFLSWGTWTYDIRTRTSLLPAQTHKKNARRSRYFCVFSHTCRCTDLFQSLLCV